MTGARVTLPRFRRLAVAVGAVCLGAAIGAPTAAAELGLPGLGATNATATGLDAPLSDITATLSETTAAPLAQVTETLEQATAPTLIETTETVAPLLEPARETQLLPATVETLGAVTESVVTPVAETLPVVEAVTQPLLQETLPTLSSTLDSAAPLSGARDAASTPDVPGIASARSEDTASAVTGDGPSIAAPKSDALVVSGPTHSDKDELPVSARRAPDIPPADSAAALPRFPACRGSPKAPPPFRAARRLLRRRPAPRRRLRQAGLSPASPRLPLRRERVHSCPCSRPSPRLSFWLCQG